MGVAGIAGTPVIAVAGVCLPAPKVIDRFYDKFVTQKLDETSSALSQTFTDNLSETCEGDNR